MKLGIRRGPNRDGAFPSHFHSLSSRIQLQSRPLQSSFPPFPLSISIRRYGVEKDTRPDDQSSIGKVWDNVKTKADDLLHKISDKAPNIDPGDFIQQTKKVLKKGSEVIQDLTGKVKSQGDDIASQPRDPSFYEEPQTTKQESKNNKTKEMLGSVKEKGKEAYDSMKEKGKETYDNMKERAKETYDNMKEKGKEAYDSTKGKENETLKKAKEAGKETVERAKEKGKESIESMKQEKESIMGRVKEIEKETFESAKEIGKQSVGNVYEKGKSAANDAVKEINHKGEELYEKGQKAVHPNEELEKGQRNEDFEAGNNSKQTARVSKDDATKKPEASQF